MQTNQSNPHEHTDTMTPFEFRRAVRHRDFRGPTAGHCGDYAQANLAILPAAYADDFLRFCMRNPKACPLLGVGEPGDCRVPVLGARPRYPHRRTGATTSTAMAS